MVLCVDVIYDMILCPLFVVLRLCGLVGVQVPFINYENDCMTSMDDRRTVLNYFLGTEHTLRVLIDSSRVVQSECLRNHYCPNMIV